MQIANSLWWKEPPAGRQKQPSQIWYPRHRQNNCRLCYWKINWHASTCAQSKCKTRPDQRRASGAHYPPCAPLNSTDSPLRPQLAVCVYMGGWHPIIVCTDRVIHLTGSAVNIFSRHIPSHRAQFGAGQRAWNSRALTPTHNLRDK